MADPFNDPKDKGKSAPVKNAGPVKAKGGSLRPDLTVVHGDSSEGPFWYGALPSLPVGSVTIAGITFMQVIEDVKYDEASQETTRSPYLGVVGRLMESQLRALVEELPRMVVRFHAEPPDETENPSTENLGHEPRKDVRRGYILRIPSSEEERKMRDAGKFRPYIPSRLDEPLADHIYLVRQDGRSQNFPAALAELGLEA